VRGARFKCDVRGRFFTQRVVGAWNSLPGEVVEGDTTVTFKSRLDKYMNRMGTERYCLLNVRGFLIQTSSMVGAGLVGRRASSCAVIFFFLFFISLKGFNGVDFLKCVQENLLDQYVKGPTGGGFVLSLILRNEAAQVVEMDVGSILVIVIITWSHLSLLWEDIDKLQTKPFGLGESRCEQK